MATQTKPKRNQQSRKIRLKTGDGQGAPIREYQIPEIPSSFDTRKYTDRILNAHWFALLFTAGHNLWYIWAETQGFKFIASLGLFGLEYLLYNIFQALREGEMVGGQKRTAIRFYYVILTFLCAGVLAQYIPIEIVRVVYYGFLLPLTGGLVVLAAVRIMLRDPFNRLEEEKAYLAITGNHEVEREKTEQLLQAIKEMKEWRLLRGTTFFNRMSWLWKEAESRRTRGILKRNARSEYQHRLKQWGVSVTPRRRLLPWGKNKTYEYPKMDEVIVSATNGERDRENPL